MCVIRVYRFSMKIRMLINVNNALYISTDTNIHNALYSCTT